MCQRSVKIAGFMQDGAVGSSLVTYGKRSLVRAQFLLQADSASLSINLNRQTF